jgi:hypothetical protein
MRRFCAIRGLAGRSWTAALLASGLFFGSSHWGYSTWTFANEMTGEASVQVADDGADAGGETRPATLAERREAARQAAEDRAEAKRSAAKASKTAAKTRGRARGGASASASVSAGGGSSAVGAGRTCGPAPFNATAGTADSAGAGFALSALASIGVGGSYGPSTALAAASSSNGMGGGNGMAGGAVDVCAKANVTLDDGTSVDVSVRVRVRPGNGPTAPDSSNDGESQTTSDSIATAGSALDAKIVEFAQNHIDQQVGNGECWTLAAEALKYADAEPPQLYVFGREVPTPEVRPGHILQFESARFEGDGYFLVLGAPNHTAIVTAVRGAKLTILHQNVNGSRVVQTGELNVDELVSGRMIVYAALPKNSRNSAFGQ